MTHERAALSIFGLTIFAGAALLFVVQLIAVRMVLPLLGGVPAVWNTSMLFFQAVLLTGYGYAHLLSRRPNAWKWHALVLIAGAVCLPIALPDHGPPPDVSPVGWLLVVLAAGVGLPFFAVSATSPLLQRWFTRTSHPDAGDPYFLYAAGNAGSLAGLLTYPLVIEPALGLEAQAVAWAWGFGLLAVGMVACGLQARKATSVRQRAGEPVTTSLRIRWVLLALVPSSLMLGVTTYISSDIAAVPMLWVLPLALYLGSFMVVFARRPLISPTAARRALPVFITGSVFLLATGATTPLLLLAGWHLVTFFLAATVCHGRLSECRPPAGRLTEFYFWMSLGGVLGSLLHVLLAPRLFRDVTEYPLMLLVALALGTGMGARGVVGRGWIAGLVLVPALVALLLVKPAGVALASAIAVGIAFLASKHGPAHSLALAGVLLVADHEAGRGKRILRQERGFFGIHRVEDDGRMRLLFHGRTVHGLQDPSRPGVPLSYYHPDGPLGSIFAGMKSEPVAVVGLGAGAIAAYGKPGQEMVFYEIDPLVASIARDPRCFSYLSGSGARCEVMLGDARLKLAEAPDDHYGLIVLDAYGSDSVPVHLLTKEALEIYTNKLRPGGRLAFHVSNLHMDLLPVVVSLSRDAGLSCLVAEDDAVTEDDTAGGRWPSRWVVAARTEGELKLPDADRRWQEVQEARGVAPWTDDRSSILPLLDFSGR